MATTRSLTLAVLSLAGFLGGCTVHSAVSPDVIYEYQQWALAHSPQPREGELMPLPGTIPPLDIHEDEQTGRQTVCMTLQDAVYRTLVSNTDIKVVSYDPAIARDRVVEAEAVFDWVVFAEAKYDLQDRQPTSFLTPSQTEDTTVNLGLRKALAETGGQMQLLYTFTRHDTDAGASEFNPYYFQSLVAQLTQPLLRNAGSTYATAQIRVARVNHAASMARFRSQVLDSLTEVETLYWQLVQARQQVEIQERLLAVSQQTLNQVMGRVGVDASDVEVSQSEAAVASRQSLLVRARNNVFDIQDRLVRAISDPRLLQCSADVVIIPTTVPSRAALQVDCADQLCAALKYSPELEQARRAIEANAIQVEVARNQLLPRLDLNASAGPTSLNGDRSTSWRKLWDMDFVDYNLGLVFEYPLGNRAAEALYSRTRHEYLKSVTTLQNTADRVAVAVSQATRQINSSYEELDSDARAVAASRRNLAAITARQEIIGQLNPESLQVRLQAQETVAATETAELQSLVNYNTAQANLTRATGTSLAVMGVMIADQGEGFVELLAERVILPATTQPAPCPTTSATEPTEPSLVEPAETFSAETMPATTLTIPGQ